MEMWLLLCEFTQVKCGGLAMQDHPIIVVVVADPVDSGHVYMIWLP
jgi:hypothetical protein